MTALAEIVAVDQAAALAQLRAELDRRGSQPTVTAGSADHPGQIVPALFIAPPEPNPGGIPPHSSVAWPRTTRKARK